VTYFFYALNYKAQSLLFKKLLYGYVIFRCIYWLMDYSLLFGEHSVITTKEFELGFFKSLAFILYTPANHYLCYPAIVVALSLSVLNLFNQKIHILSDAVLWFIILNLHNRVYPILTGGDFLLNQLLLFNCFLSAPFLNTDSLKHQLRICLHNFSILAILLQVCFLYLASGLTKLTDASWTDGQAIAMISQVDHYNLFHPVRFSMDSLPAMLLNYIVMFYQLLFPFIIWFKKTKKIFLLLGVLIHVYIAFVMGLASFGLVMLIPYVFFLARKK
jgi:hypothetical protein